MDPMEDTNVSNANDEEKYDENFDGSDAAPSQGSGSSSASGSGGHYEQEGEAEQDDDQEQEEDEEDEEEEQQLQAPAYKIPSRTIAAVEHPFLVMDVDKGLDTFGPNPQFQSVSPEPSIGDAL